MQKSIYLTLICLFLTLSQSFATTSNTDPVVTDNSVPVALSTFNHTISDLGVINFEWNTNSESSFSHFELEISSDLNVWESAAIINSSSPESADIYTSSIESVPYTRFARLKMIYSNGEYEYSENRLIVGLEVEKVEVRQNSIPHSLQLNMENITNAVVINSDGQSTQVPIQNNKSIDVNNVNPGFYLLKVEKESGETETLKYLKF